MKVFISGKITGLPNYKEKFDKAEKQLIKEGHVVMNPAKLPEGFEQEEYLKICFSMIDACEAVYFLNNWKDSPGAKREYEYACEKSKMLIFF